MYSRVTRQAHALSAIIYVIGYRLREPRACNVLINLSGYSNHRRHMPYTIKGLSHVRARAYSRLPQCCSFSPLFLFFGLLNSWMKSTSLDVYMRLSIHFMCNPFSTVPVDVVYIDCKVDWTRRRFYLLNGRMQQSFAFKSQSTRTF